jgi:hypothetical protein
MTGHSGSKPHQMLLQDAPAPQDLVHFPPEFGRRFAVFVDTEEEFDWAKPQSRDSVATSHIAHLHEFQTLADAHGIEPCYLIDYPVASTPAASDIIRKLVDGGKCTVGTQLHPWVNPPFDEEVNTFNSFVGNLPIDLERAKLAELTKQIELISGARPICYRAGRYGIGPNTGALLEEFGYLADLSVRPTFDYSGEGGPNFSKARARPYWTGPTQSLLELPLGVSFTGLLRRFGTGLYGNGKGRVISVLARTGLLSRVALTPEDMPVGDVKDSISAMLDDGMEYLSFSFHSPSVAPGHTPYVRNSAELSDFYLWWDQILTYLDRRGVDPVGLQETIDAATKMRAARK